MALRLPVSRLTKQAAQSTINKLTSTSTSSLWQRSGVNQVRTLATPVPPVTQDKTGSKGPTAMVFMNMGGPSTTDEVEEFLRRLFVG
jgi:ferrochelatase